MARGGFLIGNLLVPTVVDSTADYIRHQETL